MALLFGLLGLGFGRLGAAGGATGGGGLLPAPAAPVLTLTTGISDYLPNFSVSGDVADGDTIRLQYSTDVAFGDTLYVTGLVIGGAVEFEIDPFADLTWYFRARTERPGYDVSDWSLAVSEGIVALPSMIFVGSPWRSVLPFPTATTRASEIAVGVGLFGSI